MEVQAILSAVEPLNYRQRTRFMYKLGQRSRHEPVLQESLNTLACSSVQYQRLLALQSVWGSKENSIAAKLLADPSAQLGAMAVRVAVPLLPDDHLTEIMPSLPKPRRFTLAKSLAVAERRNIVDRILPQLDGPEIVRLLPYATADFAQNYLARDDAFPLAITDWSRLAGHFPTMAETLLKQRISASVKPDFASIAAVKAVIIALCKKNQAVLALELLKVANVKIPLRDLPYEPLTRFYPDEIAQMILASPQPEHCGLSMAALRRLDVTRLIALVNANAIHYLNLVKLKGMVLTELYRAAGEIWRGGTGTLSSGIIRRLQTEDREREARHVFALPLLANEPVEGRLFHLEYLPWEESLATAAPWLAQADADLRGSALQGVIGVGRFYPDHLDTILDFCIERKNEQEPVRRYMIYALNRLPPGRWKDAHLPKLKAIVNSALVARDCSVITVDVVVRLLSNLLPFHVNFATDELLALNERAVSLLEYELRTHIDEPRMSAFYLMRWEDRINDHHMSALSPRLLPIFELWVSLEYHHFIYSMIASFGSRLKAAPELIQLLISLTEDKRGTVASSALSHLSIRGLKRLLDAHIPVLVENDDSWIRDPTVLRHVLDRRQDLLTPFLRPRTYPTGRFPTKSGSAWAPPINNSFTTLTTAQQEACAAVQVAVVDSSKCGMRDVDLAVRRLGSMPSIDIAPLVKIANLETEDTYSRDKALVSLGRCDAGRGVPALIDALNDERARIAIYALRRAVLQMPVEAALALLKTVSQNKITVAKEVIRLAGELEGENAFDFLASYMSRPKLHADIRVALLRALWSHLDREEVWPLFAAAAESGEFGVARATIRIPQERLTGISLRRLVSHKALLLAHKNARVRHETLQRLINMPLGAAGVELNGPLSHFLVAKDVDDMRLAAMALLRGNIDISPESLGPIFAGVTSPRALLEITDAFDQDPLQHSANLGIAGRSFIHAIERQKRQYGFAAHVALVTLPADEAASTLRRFAVGKLLHPGAVDDTFEAITQLSRGRRYIDLSNLELVFSAAKQSCLRRLGLASLVALARRDGWNEERRARLTSYRQDADCWISDEADRIEVPQKPAETHQ